MNGRQILVMTLATTAFVMLALVAFFGWLDGRQPEDETTIPVPPPGHEYCVTNNGEALGFCRKS